MWKERRSLARVGIWGWVIPTERPTFPWAEATSKRKSARVNLPYGVELGKKESAEEEERDPEEKQGRGLADLPVGLFRG
jgi:hypothetical protein